MGRKSRREPRSEAARPKKRKKKKREAQRREAPAQHALDIVCRQLEKSLQLEGGSAGPSEVASAAPAAPSWRPSNESQLCAQLQSLQVVTPPASQSAPWPWRRTQASDVRLDPDRTSSAVEGVLADLSLQFVTRLHVDRVDDRALRKRRRKLLKKAKRQHSRSRKEDRRQKDLARGEWARGASPVARRSQPD